MARKTDTRALSALLKALVALRENFSGDLERALILMALLVGQGPSSLQGPGTVVEQISTRRSSTNAISRATGIPRESVRRKLEAMKARGWVVRDTTGMWSATARVSEIEAVLLEALPKGGLSGRHREHRRKF